MASPCRPGKGPHAHTHSVDPARLTDKHYIVRDMLRFWNVPVAEWAWVCTESERPRPQWLVNDDGRAVLQGLVQPVQTPRGFERAAPPPVPVIVKVLQCDTRTAEDHREHVVATAMTALVRLCGFQHTAPLLAAFPRQPVSLVMRGLTWSGKPDADVVIMVYSCAGPACVSFTDLPRQFPDARSARLALLSVLCQFAASYHLMGQLGVCHIDNHFGNALFQLVAVPYTYELNDPDPAFFKGRVLVPVIGVRVVLIDWDLSHKAPSTADALLGLPVGLRDTTGCCVGRRGAHEAYRWNPGEDWTRLGLLLRDPTWVRGGWDPWAVLGDAVGRAAFGRYVCPPGGLPPPRTMLATDPQRDRAFHFCCAGRSIRDCDPVRLPGMVHPGEALARLALLPELVAAAQAHGHRGTPTHSPAHLALSRPGHRERVASRGPPPSPWIRGHAAAFRWLRQKEAEALRGTI